MRIYFITTKLNFRTAGGSIEEYDLIIRTWQKLGNEVIAVTTFPEGNNIPEQLPYEVITDSIKSRGLLGLQIGIYKLFKKYEKQADFFHIDGHIFMYGAGLYRRLGGKVPVEAFINRELICWPENESALFPKKKTGVLKKLKKKIRWLIERYIGMFLANGVDIFTTVSPTFRAEYEKFGLKKGALVIGDPLDYKRIMHNAAIDQEHYIKRNKQTGPLTIFYSSRMAPAKGFDMLLTGLSYVRNKDKFRIVLGGTGPEEPYVKDMIRELKLEKYVELVGWTPKDKLYELYKQADIFIQADWMFFGTSMSLLYAMAFGVPSILPGGGGLEWNAQDSAIYFRYRDPIDLAVKIEILGADRELRARLSRNCYKRIFSDEMDYEKQITRVHQAMQDLLVGRTKDKSFDATRMRHS
ncbi:MAG: glycosyltransferase [Patescibacteria group bacterium]